jgi:hypothetical protein
MHSICILHFYTQYKVIKGAFCNSQLIRGSGIEKASRKKWHLREEQKEEWVGLNRTERGSLFQTVGT